MSDRTRTEIAEGPPETILVVDDEAGIRGLLTRWLAAAGYPCRQAAGVAAAREMLEAAEVALATLDITMPGESGVVMAREIRKRWPDTAVIMLTGNPDTSSAVETLTEGAWNYLVKPVAREEFLRHVAGALDRRREAIGRRRYTHELERQVRLQTEIIRRAHEETIHRLVAASLYRDEETGEHIRRTGLFGEVLARAAGWSAERAERLRLAAPMHDVGKIGIPDAILQKPGKLTPEEFEVMKTHTAIGAAMLDGSHSPMLQMAREIALAHHEHWDGRGYPRGLAGEEIPEEARIVALVDVYDALTHDRVYRPAMSEEEALGIICAGEGTHFDPRLLSLFLAMLPQLREIADTNPDRPRTAGAPGHLPTLSLLETAAAQIACAL